MSDGILEERELEEGCAPRDGLTADLPVRELRADEDLEAEVADRGRQTMSAERAASNGKGGLASDEEAVAAR